MDDTAPPIEYVRFEGSAPDDVWSGVERVYVLGFAAPPYSEPPEELRAVQRWGRAMLAGPGGCLTAALRDGQVVGFAISERLDQDEPWQRLLEDAAASGGPVPRASPSATVILQELAVDPGQRGQGVARRLVVRLLADRSESDAVLSVYGRAEDVAAMYRRWGFREFGTAPAEGGGDTLHLMHRSLPWGG